MILFVGDNTWMDGSLIQRQFTPGTYLQLFGILKIHAENFKKLL